MPVKLVIDTNTISAWTSQAHHKGHQKCPLSQVCHYVGRLPVPLSQPVFHLARYDVSGEVKRLQERGFA
jgi:hypothetical protein